MKKVLFIDRDGTILIEPWDKQLDSFEKLTFLPGVITSLSKIAAEMDYELVIVSNQDGLGTHLYPEDTFWPIQNKMLEILRGEGVIFSEIFIDRSLPGDNAPTRKPGTAMLTQYLAQGIDLASSFVIGDRSTDIKLAENLGCGAIFINADKSDQPVFNTTSWNEIYSFLKSIPRKARVTRKTSETEITVEVNLDGTGRSDINSGIGFFDHMLNQVARHGGMDLFVAARGDLHIDEHHTIEDTGLALGEAVLKAAGSRKGTERYGFSLPMDDGLASVLIDLGGRPWLVWDVTFTREKIGEMPSEMFFHFFKSFSDAAKCNLNIRAEGQNDHHKAEAVFKAFAKAIGNAARKTGSYALPSTKGTI